ncbi:MAG: hypothetical protein H6553_02535 [Chitinophagales bacterium]|nr:hypothetical protein [Chitinophagales bacterium]
MDIFTLITNDEQLQTKLLNKFTEEDFYIKDNGDNQFLLFNKSELNSELSTRNILIVNSFEIDESSDEYEEKEKKFVKSILKEYPYYYINFDYKINYTYNLLYDVIDIINSYIIETNQENNILIEDDFSSYLSSFPRFLEKWNKERAFFHQKDYKEEQELL